MSEKIYILAGNYQQFLMLRRQLTETMACEGIDFGVTDIHYIGDPFAIRGTSGIWGYRTGTWASRPDIDDIIMMLSVYRSSIDDFIEVEL